MADAAHPLLSTFSDQLADTVGAAAQSVVAVRFGEAVMSGIHWRPGIVVTAEESLDRDDDITLTLPDGRSAAASLAGRDPTTDIAVLRFPPDGLASAQLGDAATLRPGQLALAVGRGEAGPVAGFGIVAVAGESWQSRQGGTIDRLIRLDLALSPVGEGGALVDAAGRILGMTVPGPRRRVLAIPASTIDRVTDQLLAAGRIARGYLGAGLQGVPLGKARGVLVLSIDPKGPAASAGMVIGDIVTGWAGAPVGSVRGILRRLGPDSVGTAAELTVLRGGAETLLTVTIGERPVQ